MSIKPELCVDMPFDTYRKAAGLNISSLKNMNISPAYCKYMEGVSREQTEAMMLGSVVDAYLLDNKEFEKVAVAPDVKRNTKEGKATYEEFVNKNLGKLIVPSKIYAEAIATAKAVHTHPTASKLLAGGMPQLSFFWDELGIRCKGRSDSVKDNVLTDLKTTGVLAHPSSWFRELRKRRYVNQLAWYRRGLRACGLDIDHCVLIVVESKPPHGVKVYRIKDRALELADRQNIDLLEQYKACSDSGIWSGYSEEVVDIDLPEFDRQQMEEEYGNE